MPGRSLQASIGRPALLRLTTTALKAFVAEDAKEASGRRTGQAVNAISFEALAAEVGHAAF
jgi:hypothetical protein